MSEDWVDCPSLGPGWQRREVIRKSGITHGQSDTYYISPRGEKIRSRVELLRLLGCSRDLTDFDYKKGIFVEPNAEPMPSPPLSPTEGSLQKQVKRGGKKRLLPLAGATHLPRKPPDLQVLAEPCLFLGQELPEQKPPMLELEMPVENLANIQSQQTELPVNSDQLAPKPHKRHYQKHIPSLAFPGKMEDLTPQDSNSKEAMACCASCHGQFPEARLPSQRRCRWLCPDCRAQRRAFNREQRYYKSLECGLCQACKITEDCGTCVICLRRQKPGMKRQWKCLQRRCHKRKKKQLGVAKQRKKMDCPPKHPATKLKNSMLPSKSRQNRKCGKCEACLLKMDCGHCDFCYDKPKFGGQNLKRQKCRWRQCLQFAMESSSTSELTELPKSLGLGKPTQQEEELQVQLQSQPPPPPPLLLPLKLQKEPEKTTSTVSQEPMKDSSALLSQNTKEQDVAHHHTSPSWVLGKDPDNRLPAVSLLIATSPKIKQDVAEPGGDCQPSSDSPVSAGLPQFKRPQGIPGSEVVVIDDAEDNEMDQLQQVRLPVIMEIYSLGGMQPLTQLDSVLQEFLAELNEIPLPAHWEVLPPTGHPDLRLVQRSKHSTMSAAVIHIRPGLFFHVVVQDLPVPPEHKLYASHPARLTTVDEVVELICDLEAYRLCSGRPASWHAGERSEACDVLVYSGCCLQCRLNPWPSGSGIL